VSVQPGGGGNEDYCEAEKYATNFALMFLSILVRPPDIVPPADRLRAVLSVEPTALHRCIASDFRSPIIANTTITSDV